MGSKGKANSRMLTSAEVAKLLGVSVGHLLKISKELGINPLKTRLPSNALGYLWDDSNIEKLLTWYREKNIKKSGRKKTQKSSWDEGRAIAMCGRRNFKEEEWSLYADCIIAYTLGKPCPFGWRCPVQSDEEYLKCVVF